MSQLWLKWYLTQLIILKTDIIDILSSIQHSLSLIGALEYGDYSLPNLDNRLWSLQLPVLLFLFYPKKYSFKNYHQTKFGRKNIIKDWRSIYVHTIRIIFSDSTLCSWDMSSNTKLLLPVNIYHGIYIYELSIIDR